MTKNKKQVQAAELETAGASASYSTRFEPKQREVIEEAARLVDCSPAKFIRDAAVGRAVDVVNSAASPGDLKILARELIEHLLNPKAEVIKVHEDHDVPTSSVVSFSQDTVSLKPAYDEDPLRVTGVKVLRPERNVLEQIKSAMETSGTEFVKLLLAEWQSGQKEHPKYKPTLRAGDILVGEEA